MSMFISKNGIKTITQAKNYLLLNQNIMKVSKSRYSRYEKGKIKCILCGGYFKKVCSHVTQKHGMTAREYKKLLGVTLFYGILSKESKKLASKRVLDNPEIIRKNLIEKGIKTRIKKGSNFRAGIR